MRRMHGILRGNDTYTLREAGVRLVYGPDVGPLYEPRDAPPVRELPWSAVLDAVDEVTK
jgi:hypothetical protein